MYEKKPIKETYDRDLCKRGPAQRKVYPKRAQCTRKRGKCSVRDATSTPDLQKKPTKETNQKDPQKRCFKKSMKGWR